MFRGLRDRLSRRLLFAKTRQPNEILQSALARMQTMLERNLGGGKVTVVLTSCREGEGVSSLAIAYARTVAKTGRSRVLLIDANLRRPDLHRWLGLDRAVGLGDQLAGRCTQGTIVRDMAMEGFSFLPAGTVGVDPAALLGGAAWEETLGALRDQFDVIIVDSPPLLDFADAPLLGRAADGVILVLTAELTRWEVAQHGKDLLEGAGASLLGVVLNRKPQYIPDVFYRFL